MRVHTVPGSPLTLPSPPRGRGKWSETRYTIRHGWVGVNPVALLEPGEKPRWRLDPVRIMEGAELARLLQHAGTSRVLFEFLAYTGLRISARRWGCGGVTGTSRPACYTSASSFPGTARRST